MMPVFLMVALASLGFLLIGVGLSILFLNRR